jgi:hypothetical protein
MGLKEAARAAFVELHLRLDYRAENVTYQPKNGPARTVRALINGDLARQRDETQDANTETIEASFGRDEAHQYGGVQYPQRGDKLTREGDERPYGFTGRVISIEPAWLRAEFSRVKERDVGTAHRK